MIAESIPEQVWISINALQILGIIYLAVAISRLQQRLSKMEGKEEQRQRDNGK